MSWEKNWFRRGPSFETWLAAKRIASQDMLYCPRKKDSNNICPQDLSKQLPITYGIHQYCTDLLDIRVYCTVVANSIQCSDLLLVVHPFLASK